VYCKWNEVFYICLQFSCSKIPVFAFECVNRFQAYLVLVQTTFERYHCMLEFFKVIVVPTANQQMAAEA